MRAKIADFSFIVNRLSTEVLNPEEPAIPVLVNQFKKLLILKGVRLREEHLDSITVKLYILMELIKSGDKDKLEEIASLKEEMNDDAATYLNFYQVQSFKISRMVEDLVDAQLNMAIGTLTPRINSPYVNHAELFLKRSIAFQELLQDNPMDYSNATLKIIDETVSDITSIGSRIIQNVNDLTLLKMLKERQESLISSLNGL